MTKGAEGHPRVVDDACARHVHVHLDGEKVGCAIVKAKRSTEARSFMPVAHAEAGACSCSLRRAPRHLCFADSGRRACDRWVLCNWLLW